MSMAMETPETPPESRKHSFAAIEYEIATILDVDDVEIAAEDKAKFDAYLDELAEQEAEKIDGFVRFLRSTDASAKFYREESARLAAKARAAEARIEYLKSRYLQIMQANNLKKVKGNVYSVAVRRSERVDVPSVYALPPEYQKPQEPKPDKEAIKSALKEGKEVAGARLVESFSLQTR